MCSHSRSCASAAYHIVCPSSLFVFHRNRGRHLARSTADLPSATNPSRGLAMGNVVVFASCPSRQDQRVVENLLRLGRPLRPMPSICGKCPACLTYIHESQKEGSGTLDVTESGTHSDLHLNTEVELRFCSHMESVWLGARHLSKVLPEVRAAGAQWSCCRPRTGCASLGLRDWTPFRVLEGS